MLARKLLVALPLFLLATACDDGATTGSGGSGGVGEGGAGGEAPGCETGSHDDGGGKCAASLGAFSETSPIAKARDHHVTFWAETPAGKFMYVLGGGVDMSSYEKSMERAPIQADGSLGPWETLTSELTTAGPMIAKAGRTVALLGGQQFSNLAKTWTLTISDTGDLSAPVQGPSLNRERFHGAAVAVGDFVYAVGGMDKSGTSLTTVERASFSESGLGSFAEEAITLPEGRSHHGLAYAHGALYVTGGLQRIDNDFANDLGFDAVLRSVIAPDGAIGAFEQVGTLPRKLAVHSSFVFADRLYVAHGLDMDTLKFLKEFWSAPINEDGSVGAFEQLTPAVPLLRGHCHQTPIVDGFLYSIAGTNNAGSQNESYFARFE